jgi:hypothetical protein
MPSPEHGFGQLLAQLMQPRAQSRRPFDGNEGFLRSLIRAAKALKRPHLLADFQPA